jgi:hypothetical protein
MGADMQEFQTGDRVQIQDRDRAVENYPYATVVRFISRGEAMFGTPDDKAGYLIRYESNGCEVWRREYDVLAPRPDLKAV